MSSWWNFHQCLPMSCGATSYETLKEHFRFSVWEINSNVCEVLRSQQNISQIPQCICSMSHNAPFRIEKCEHFCSEWRMWDMVLKTPLHWRHNDHDSVWNHQPHGCLLNRLFRHRSKKTSKLRVTGPCVENSPEPVNSPHKGPVARKMFPFDDVIMGRGNPGDGICHVLLLTGLRFQLLLTTCLWHRMSYGMGWDGMG